MKEALFICPHCEETSTADEWNGRTQDSYGVGIIMIYSNDASECVFICPACDAEIDYETIQKIDNIPTENEEALCFLKEEW